MIAAESSTSALERIADIGCILGGYCVAEHLAIWLSSRKLFIFPSQWAEYWLLVVVAIALWIAVSSYRDVYRSHRAERLDFATAKLAETILLWAMMTVAGVFALKLHDVSRQFTCYVILFAALSLMTRQLVVMVIVRRVWRFGYSWRTALVIGQKASCERFAQLLSETFPMGYRVVQVPLRGDESKAEVESVGRHLPEAEDAFVISGAEICNSLTLHLLKEGKCVHLVPELWDARLFRHAFGDVAGIPVISLLSGSRGVVQAALKRLADVVVASIVLILGSPLFGLIFAIIKMSSDGPVIFGQRRLGKNGKPFSVLKFRTMVQNAEQILQADPSLYHKYVANNFKLPAKEDPRITKIGALLRATSLDELPQLINVIRGDMSLVGPRPVVPAEVEKYGDYSSLFLSAKPGMTGHWQVSGRSDIEEYSKRVELDLEYIRDQSLGKDFEILWRTLPAVLLRRGAH
jgi:exopolysaccharide production protein ExoY